MVRTLRPISPENTQLLVFDLDGTLIDSRQDLCNSVNATLRNFGLPALDDATIAGFIGDGAAMLIRRALAAPAERAAGVDPTDEAFFQQAFTYFLTWYRAHKLDNTYIYPSVLESLQALRTLPDGTPRPMAVLTNKPVGPARAICDALGLADFCFQVYGGDSFPSKKPDPEGLLSLIAQAGVTPSQTTLIGDSDVDVRTARNAGTAILGCTFGLAPESLEEAQPDVLVDHASEWPFALGLTPA